MKSKPTNAIVRLVVFLASRPKWLVKNVKDIRRIGLYEFVDSKGRTFNILLSDSVATAAIYDSSAHGAREMVLRELRRVVAVDTRCPDFVIPEAIYLWSHSVKGFKSIARLRDATRSERKEYIGTPVRTGLVEYLECLAAR